MNLYIHEYYEYEYNGFFMENIRGYEYGYASSV